MNRLTLIQNEFTKGPVGNMGLLMNVLAPSTIIPDPDKYYVFVYKAKTPNIIYDAHPFVLVNNIFKWGFTGYNFHWDEMRKYSWAEVRSNLYEIYEDELNIVENINLTNIKTT